MIDNSQSKEITARKLIHYRKLKHWTQSQIANKINITRARYVSYEDGRNHIPYRFICDLCLTYGITLDEFENLKIYVTPRNNMK